ncbi:MAG: DEAD/DEAH box helicase [Alphaproteobacteria bacterium]|nr:DEAD/DEAH box helicase [Alphaproteobacteria bacterium]
MNGIKPILNSSQMAAFNTIERTNSNVLILGPAGTGKSTFINYLKSASKKRIICACPTAVSALNVGGQTIHSLFQIQPRDFIMPELLKLKAKPRNILNATDVLIIDEISMVAPDLLDAIDILARYARRNNAPFGGIQVVGIGDVFQLPPVITCDAMGFYSDEYGQPNSYFFDSHVYKRADFVAYNFDQVYRQHDNELLDNLIKLRNNQTDSLAFFNNCQILDEQRRQNAVVITPFRAVADRINQSRLAQIPQTEVVYNGIVSGAFSERDVPAPMELKLKVGALVVFVKNSDKWHNGSMGIVRDMTAREIVVQLLSDNHETVSVKPDKWEKIEYSRDENDRLIENEIGSYKQFPLMLGYAMTIHKAQGKTLDAVVLDISRGAFAHGQVYVALSRTRRKSDMHIASPLRARDVIFDTRVLEFVNNL